MNAFYQAHQQAFIPIKKGDKNPVCDFDDDFYPPNTNTNTNTQTINHTKNLNIHLVQLTATTDNAPDIWVCASIDDNAHAVLQLSYFIEFNPWLSADFCGDNTTTIKPIRQDFLWEDNCLECFFDLKNHPKNHGDNHKASGYFELNIAPKVHKDNGTNTVAFNLYQFNDYRTPSTLPPPWADGQITHFAMRAYTGLNYSSLKDSELKESGLKENDLKASDLKEENLTNKNFYAYHIALVLGESVFLNHTLDDKCNGNECDTPLFIDKIHPCVILYHDKKPIYYATCHANPPDFHNKAYWQSFED